MNLSAGFEDTRIGMAMGVVAVGFILFFLFGAVVLLVNFLRSLGKKENRKSAGKSHVAFPEKAAKSSLEISKFFLTDKEAIKHMKWNYLVLGSLLLLLLFVVVTNGI